MYYGLVVSQLSSLDYSIDSCLLEDSKCNNYKLKVVQGQFPNEHKLSYSSLLINNGIGVNRFPRLSEFAL